MAMKKKTLKQIMDEEVKEDVDVKTGEIETRRNVLINELRPKLLTKSQLKTGGGNVKSRHTAEQGYVAIIDEINLLGRELGLPPIGFDSLRKE